MVSENSALVRVNVPVVAGAAAPKITLGGTDISNLFTTGADGSLQAVVTGLQSGKSTISVAFNGATSALDVVSHGRNGPIISGPQQTPWICQTADFVLPDNTKLGQSQDSNCNVPSKVLYMYMPTAGGIFKPMPSATAVPSDIKTTVTTDGRMVNYIVRVETGTINRSIYQFALLYDPTTESAISPTARYRAWNRKLIYTFGGSATAGYVQGLSTGGVMNDLMLSQGFAVISSSTNVFGNNENDVLSAESVSMVKEKFIKSFGVPLYTMGWGNSGGAMQQHLIANNYPGLLDGITPDRSWSDLLTVVPSATDCSLMSRAFAGSSLGWTNEQKTAVSGFKDYATCVGGDQQISRWQATFSPSWVLAKRGEPTLLGALDLTNCLMGLPSGLTYDPITNRNGARCDVYSSLVNLLGIEPATGFAARAIDNVGVQYGLKAFQSGAISAEQFVDLNERVGGYDPDGNFQSSRTTASALGLNAAYAFGRVNQAANLNQIPIIDHRVYQDPDIHNASRSLSTRQRIFKANGSAANHVILRGPNLAPIALKSMDAWLSSLSSDTKSYANQSAKVAANKPTDLVDACYTTTGTKIAEAAEINNGGQCGVLYPYFTNPRIVAGAPLSDDILKCQLKPLLRADYAGISDAQFARLGGVFTTGVCDFSKPSVGSTPLQSTWLSFPRPGQPTLLSGAPY
ncbi:DUF6351 family protein [Variovorax sp. WS11]|nr:DUF6351 family protein [Variovorax sp. WS11]NDZ18945.1 hypothetical protein [Variovorax sp. WS11]